VPDSTQWRSLGVSWQKLRIICHVERRSNALAFPGAPDLINQKLTAGAGIIKFACGQRGRAEGH